VLTNRPRRLGFQAQYRRSARAIQLRNEYAIDPTYCGPMNVKRGRSRREPAFREPTPTVPSRQPFLADRRDLTGVPAYSSKVARYAIVGIVAPHHRDQMGVLLGDGLRSFRNWMRHIRDLPVQTSGLTLTFVSPV
jgi:hypothetical protein